MGTSGESSTALSPGHSYSHFIWDFQCRQERTDTVHTLSWSVWTLGNITCNHGGTGQDKRRMRIVRFCIQSDYRVTDLQPDRPSWLSSESFVVQSGQLHVYHKNTQASFPIMWCHLQMKTWLAGATSGKITPTIVKLQKECAALCAAITSYQKWLLSLPFRTVVFSSPRAPCSIPEAVLERISGSHQEHSTQLKLAVLPSKC